MHGGLLEGGADSEMNKTTRSRRKERQYVNESSGQSRKCEVSA